MSIYTVEIDGKQYDLEGDHPPSEAEARAAIGQQATQPTGAPDPMSALSKASSIGNPRQRVFDLGKLVAAGKMKLNDPQMQQAFNADQRETRVNNAALLPSAAGAAGAALGGGNPLTAGAGGVVGEAMRQAALRDMGITQGVPQTVGGQAASMGLSGVEQAIAELAGKGVNALGHGLYAGGAALLPRTLKQQFPNIARSGFDEGIALTKGGAAKAAERAAESGAAADTAISAAENAAKSRANIGAATVSPQRVLASLGPVQETMRTRTALGLPDESGALSQRSSDFINRNPGGITLTDAQTMKREAQNLAQSAYRAQDRGANVNGTDLLMNEAQAKGLRQELENKVPGLADINARTQGLIGLERAAEHASGTGHILSRLGGAGVSAMMAGPAGTIPAIAAGGAGMLATTPGGLTMGGLGLKAAAPLVPSVLRGADIGTGGTPSDALRRAFLSLLLRNQQPNGGANQ